MNESSTADVDVAIAEMAPWFHNLHLPGGIQTAPSHALGDFPHSKWVEIAPYVPGDLSGWTVLDVGCNAGFYSFELAHRGAHVTAIDLDAHYLRQAEWAARQFGLQDQVRFHQRQVYELAADPLTYDLVWFMGVFYNLRYPLLALDILARKTKRLMMFQTMTMPGDEVLEAPPDLTLDEREWMCQSGWPRMAFIEKRVAGDPTNWWAPNHSCVLAMLRSCGLRVVAQPAHEIYLCEPEFQTEDELSQLNESEFRAATGRRSQ